MRGMLLVLLVAAGCDEGGRHGVTVRVADGARAEIVEVSIVRSCLELRDMRNRPEAPIASVTVRGQRGEALGDIPAGKYGLHARAIDASCVVYAADCDPITVSAETSEPFELYISGRPERYECGPGEACDRGECIDFGSPPSDAGVEPDAEANDPDDGGKPDASTGDEDGDQWSDEEDNCPLDFNPEQFDADLDGVGDACDDAFGPCEEGAEDCDACVECSDVEICQEWAGPCTEGANTDCAEFLECYVACFNDSMCLDNCVMNFPEGYEEYEAYYVCTICQGCPNRCYVDLGNQPCEEDPAGGGG